MPPPWLPPVTATPRRVCQRMVPGHLDGQDGVCIDPPVVVVVRVEYPLCHEPGMGRCRPHRVRGVARAPRGALAPRVHREAAVAGQGPGADFMRQSAAAAITDKAHDNGQRAGSPGWYVEPGPDRVATEPRKGHVEAINEGQTAVDPIERRRLGTGTGAVESRGPEDVQVVRRHQMRSVLSELVRWQFVQWHGLSPGPRRRASGVRHGSRPSSPRSTRHFVRLARGAERA